LSLYDFLGIRGSDELGYLATHFYELDGTLVKEIGQDRLRESLRSERLQHSSENSQIETGDFGLLGRRHTDYLSQSSVSRLLDSISFGEVDEELWKNL
jgi:hypothetical protein